MRFSPYIVFLTTLVTPALASADATYSFSATSEVLGAKSKDNETAKSHIDTLLGQSEQNVRECYEKQSNKNPDVHYDIEFAIFVVIDNGTMSFYGLPEVRQKDVWDWDLYSCVASEIKSWRPDRVSAEVELRFSFVANIDESAPTYLATSVGKPLTIQSGEGFELRFATEFTARLGVKPKGQSPWNICGESNTTPIEGDVQVQIMVDEYGFVRPLSPQWLGTGPLDGRTLECFRSTLEDLVGPTMPVTEDRSGYHLAVNIQFDRQPVRTGDQAGEAKADPSNHAIPVVDPIGTATNVCSTLVDAESGQLRRSEFGKACSRLPGCGPGDANSEAATLRALQRQLQSLDTSARQCKGEQCQAQLRRFETRCRTVLEAETSD